MAHIVEVSDAVDPRVDDFRDLSRADRRPDRPGGRGLVIAEGVVVVERLLASPYPVRALFGVRRRVDELLAATMDLDVPAYVTDADVMARVVGFHLNRGVLAVADRAPVIAPAELIGRSRRLAVLEGIGDHENLGALFRNAAALGVDGVLLGAGCSDPLYRRSVRVSMGHVLRVPFAHLDSWPEDLKLLRDNGFRVAALTPRADARALRDAALDRGSVAVLLGSEGPGLTDEAIAAADLAVRIPMVGGVDSLNVATAGAITFHAMSGA
ncbi:TrmH family RNA methyltransferase [Saccharopolyspora phatthalungensis]|uniref:tRNA G18 (Ribose-2'-O)-methylase SpoU n=1 Tax=Saccharopolyspora phatthalungensis TaxID=664693 RepID=A0A840Q524_9PSEU|nr:RNA methyltransferase [Saccharopolyspora phatthalungensis]MBB5153789.1 tRNA G18 (ribose-2'-O)-methylase SpoU [Saccharopolyspora phatthalungensis]